MPGSVCSVSTKSPKRLRLALQPSYFYFPRDAGSLKVKAQNCFHQSHEFWNASCTVLISHCRTGLNPDSPATMATCWFRMNWIVGLSLRGRVRSEETYQFLKQTVVHRAHQGNDFWNSASSLRLLMGKSFFPICTNTVQSHFLFCLGAITNSTQCHGLACAL